MRFEPLWCGRVCKRAGRQSTKLTDCLGVSVIQGVIGTVWNVRNCSDLLYFVISVAHSGGVVCTFGVATAPAVIASVRRLEAEGAPSRSEVPAFCWAQVQKYILSEER